MKILVTGGTGYIGSHTCVELLDAGYEIVVIDNLSNSKIEVVDKIKEITGKDFKFYEGDCCDKDILTKIFCIVLGLESLVLMLTFVFNALFSLSSDINAEKRRADQEKREIEYHKARMKEFKK